MSGPAMTFDSDIDDCRWGYRERFGSTEGERFEMRRKSARLSFPYKSVFLGSAPKGKQVNDDWLHGKASSNQRSGISSGHKIQQRQHIRAYSAHHNFVS